QDFRGSVRVDVQLVDGGALGAQRALVVRAARITLDVRDLAVHRVDERGAAHRAIGTDARVRFRVLDPELRGRGQRGGEIGAETDEAAQCGGAAGGRGDAHEIAPGDVHVSHHFLEVQCQGRKRNADEALNILCNPLQGAYRDAIQ